MNEPKYRKCKKCWITRPEADYAFKVRELSATQKEEYYLCPQCGGEHTEPAKPRYYVDIKESAWRRVTLDEDIPKEELDKVLAGNIGSVWEYEAGDDIDNFEEMTVEENGGCSTVEVYRDDYQSGTLLYQNGDTPSTPKAFIFSKFVHGGEDVL